MKTAFVFPGQGSQKVGMLQDLYNAYPIVKQRFEEADEALGYSISKLCFEGPDTELVKTANTQPAILTASVACYEVLKENGFTPDIVGGHSLGEYSALARNGFQRRRSIASTITATAPSPVTLVAVPKLSMAI